MLREVWERLSTAILLIEEYHDERKALQSLRSVQRYVDDARKALPLPREVEPRRVLNADGNLTDRGPSHEPHEWKGIPADRGAWAV
jgi:hypothetical protein